MGALVSPVNAMRAAGPEANNEACVCVCVSKMCVLATGSMLERYAKVRMLLLLKSLAHNKLIEIEKKSKCVF